MAIEAAEPRCGNEALAECARAAVSWLSGSDPAEERLARLRRGMAWAARANDGTPPAGTLSDFLALLERPVAEWLPGVLGPSLAEQGCASEFAEDVVAETGGPEADAEAEVVQARIGEARVGFALRGHGDVEYRDFRRFLIDHAYASMEEAQRGLLAAGFGARDLFEEVPSTCLVSSARGPAFHPCPRCKWPMFRFGGVLQCASTICRSEGACFQEQSAGFVPLGKAPLPSAVPSASHMRLHRGIWRYTLQPGLVELDLHNRLRRIAGIQVELWPQRDRYDLRIQLAESTWLVDVKDWSRAHALADYFTKRAPTESLVVVVPNWRRDQLVLLRDRCRQPNLSFHTLRQFLRLVRSRAGQNGRRRGKAKR